MTCVPERINTHPSGSLREVGIVENFLMRVLENIPEGKPMSLLQLTRKSGLDHRTIRKYLQLIMEIQEGGKIVREHVGMRVFVKKDHSNRADGSQLLSNQLPADF